MGDFFLDDQFPEHPKALFVGDAACWLYTCGLAWANKHNTGLIPKAAVSRLTGHKNNTALARKLATVAPGETNPLWHDEGDYYRIHDWHVRNAKKIIKREQSQRAAHAKWEKFYADRDAGASASAEIPQTSRQSGTAADALPYQPGNQRTNEPACGVVGTGHSRRLTVVHDDEEDEGTRAVRILSERALARREAEKGPVGNRDAWLARDFRDRLAHHEPGIRDALNHFAWKPEKLARHLEPEAFPEDAPKLHLDFHPLECDCGGQGTDRNCDGPGEVTG